MGCIVRPRSTCVAGSRIRRDIVRWWSVALAAAAASGLLVANAGAADYYQQRLPDGVDTLMPRYYDYRAPRAYYPDEAPVALRIDVNPGAVGYFPQPYVGVLPPPSAPAPIVTPVGAPVAYAPSGYPAPVGAYAPPPVPGYAPAPVVPTVGARSQPICGVFRYWRDGRCVDARGY
jgi:hypothetical protein